MIIWGGWVASSGGLYEIEAAQNGAAYDPATDSWRMLPDLPDDLQLSHHTAVWTGSEMIIWGANFEARDRSGSQDGIPRLAGASYDPATGRWRTIASPPFATVEQIEFFGAHSSVWTGTRMVVWAGGGFVSASGPELWLYEPKSDMWERGAPAPLDAADPVLVWADGRVYAYGGADFGQLRRTLAIDLGPEGATVPPFPGDNSPVDIGEPVPFRVLALEIDDREVVAATEIDLNAGIRTTFDSDDLAAPLETVTGVLPLRRGWLTISNESVMAFPDGLYRPPIVVADFAGRDDAITAATIPTLDGEERLWLVVAEPGRTTARFIRGFQYPVTLEIGLPSAAQPVAAAGNRLLVNLPNDAGQTDVAVIETGGRVERLTEGVGLGLVASRVVWLDCAQACSIRVSSVVAGPGDHDVIISPQNGWAFAAPLPQSGRSVVAPNGRHVVLPYHRSGDEGEPAMVLVDLSTGTLEPIRDGVAGNVRGGPGVTWSSDSTWVLLSGGSLDVAINVVDGRRVDLSGLLPDGATVAATAPIG